MIWHYFPIGMRFPVPDFSDETKRACWKIALSAAFASDAGGTTLYEAVDPFDAGSQSAVYTCIVCYVPIKQSRLAGKTMHALDGLMSRLCVHNPLVQANYLESFGPYPILGEIRTSGTVIPSESGAAFLPEGPVEPMRKNDGWELLLACDDETRSRELAVAAAENGYRVRRLLTADGGEGTVRALVSGTNGRYETISVTDASGNRHSRTIGVIPGKTAVLETACENDAEPSCTEGDRIRAVLDLGYRRLLIASGDAQPCDFGADDASDPRLRQCEITVLSAETSPSGAKNAGTEWILDRIGFGVKARSADFAIVCSDRIGTIETVLSGLSDQERPCCLLTDAAFDPKELRRAFPTLRGVIRLTDADAETPRPVSAVFTADVLPLIGKTVAKTGDL
ncbi:MAG: glycerate kinase [Clostridia bacterium]|nr:glycerate kinase [Clostridia bacterium]